MVRPSMPASTVVVLLLLLLLGAGVAAAGWEEGVSAFKSKNYAKAAEELRGVVASRPDFAPGHFLLGQSLSHLDKKGEALNHLRKAYDLDPASMPYRIALARAYLEVRRASEAVALLRGVDRSAVPVENRFSVQLLLSLALSAQQQWAAADEAARVAVELATGPRQSRQAWRQIGFVNEKLKNYDAAVVAYRNAGDEASRKRAETNQQIAAENRQIEAENRRVEEMKEEAEELERRLRELEGESPPPR